jgi:hypothetical protein
MGDQRGGGEVGMGQIRDRVGECSEGPAHGGVRKHLTATRAALGPLRPSGPVPKAPVGRMGVSLRNPLHMAKPAAAGWTSRGDFAGAALLVEPQMPFGLSTTQTLDR